MMKHWKPLLILIPLFFACAEGGKAAAETGDSDSVPLIPWENGDPYATLRQACVDFTNEMRVTESKAPLALWDSASACTDQQAKNDVTTNQAHGHFGACGEGAQNTCPNWPTGGDTTSQRQTLLRCLTNMWAEGPGEPYSEHGHYINMSNTKYSKVTCGFYYSDGKLWVNQNFR